MAQREGDNLATERTPLLPSTAAHTAPEARSNVTANGAFQTPLDDAASGKSIKLPRKRRWATLIALILLCLICIAVLVIGFFAPAAAEQYAREAVTVNVSGLSIESFTPQGVQARVKAKVNVDASRVKNGFVRILGRLGTAIAKEVSTKEGELHVFLLDYDDALLGNASIPPMVIDVRDGHSNFYDFISTVEPVSLDTAQKVVEDYLDGKLKSLEVMGSTRLVMRSGILPLGNQLFMDTMKFEGKSDYIFCITAQLLTYPSVTFSPSVQRDEPQILRGRWSCGGQCLGYSSKPLHTQAQLALSGLWN